MVKFLFSVVLISSALYSLVFNKEGFFIPGKQWKDTNGVHINAHGGGIVFVDGIYYVITSGCTGWDPNEARSFSSKSIWGPWEFLGNPCVGKGAELTFHSQSTYVFPVAGKKDQFIFMADRWKPDNPIDGSYVWLPIKFDKQKPVLSWLESWNLDVF